MSSEIYGAYKQDQQAAQAMNAPSGGQISAIWSAMPGIQNEFAQARNSDSMDLAAQDLAAAFPVVDPENRPVGGRILVQYRRLSNKSKGGIVLAQESSDTAEANNQIAKVVAMGSLAFRNRETNEPWREGAWCKVGDFVRIPRWDGDRWQMPTNDGGNDVRFAIFNDHQVIAVITGNPLTQRVYVL